MVETVTGTDRSAGTTYQELLDQDSRPVPDMFRVQNPMPKGPTIVPAEQYFSQEFHDLEVEKMWKRVWQMACHQDDIPEVGDYHIYEIAHLSYLVVRTGEDEFRAYINACLHRGRMLKVKDGKRAREFRCAFHGWAWNLDGQLKEVPCEWDFPTVSAKTHSLPEIKVGRWGGYIFINPDENAEPFEDYIGILDDQFTTLPYERRYKSAHVAKLLRCNWKVAQEAFSEAYHSIATHPTILDSIGDANTQYDVFGNFSRAMSPNYVKSPHVEQDWEELEDGRLFTKLRHQLTGHVYEMCDDGLVHVTNHKGEVSKFKPDATWVEGPMTQVDPNMCNWIGGQQLPGGNVVPLGKKPKLEGNQTMRQVMAEPVRESFRAALGDKVDSICDAELVDSIYLTLFPNFHPWGCFNSINYRFRPNGDNPNECIMECMYLSPIPDDGNYEPVREVHWLGFDDDWCEAPELGLLAKVFNQDIVNMPEVQRGLRMLKVPEIIFANYGETKPRHFHKLLDEWIEKP